MRASSCRRCGAVYLLLWVPLSGAGCISPAVRDREILDTPVPERVFLPYPTAVVWPTLLEEISPSRGVVLARDDDARLVTWISEIGREGERLHESLLDIKIAKRRTALFAVTMVRAETVEGGTQLMVRQIYIPSDSALGTSHSRGTFERYFIDRLRQRIAHDGGKDDEL